MHVGEERVKDSNPGPRISKRRKSSEGVLFTEIIELKGSRGEGRGWEKGV